VAYIVDVYRRKIEPCRDFVSYALFISFFPHLVAGPIQCPAHLLPQTSSPRCYAPGRVFDGLMLIVTGLFRKCVIADNCALLANAAFSGQLGKPSTATVLLGMYAFVVRFTVISAAYSDIARGAPSCSLSFQHKFATLSRDVSRGRFWSVGTSVCAPGCGITCTSPSVETAAANAGKLNLLATLLGRTLARRKLKFVMWGGIHGVD
jgi:D-alanyl-lipoteichoic acid acyltransferase DltB (MBOAT superfamily)